MNASQSLEGISRTARPNRRKLWILVALGIVVCIAVFGAVFAVVTSQNSAKEAAAQASEAARLAKFTTALEHCTFAGNVSVTDGGQTMIIRGKPTAGTDTLDGVDKQTACVLKELQIPGSVTSQIGNTRAIDGVQSGSWDDITAKWTYHPDNGLNMTLVLVN